MEMPALETAIAMIIKFGITATFLIVILYCTELFPTTLRWVFPTEGVILSLSPVFSSNKNQVPSLLVMNKAKEVKPIMLSTNVFYFV